MSNINFGNWQDLEKLQAQNQWVDPHANAFGGLLRTLDPMTYVPGVNVTANTAHDMGDQFVNGANRVLSPIVTGADKVTTTITPGLSQAREAIPMLGNVQNFANNKPFDTAALMAATFFSGGAAADAIGSGAAAAPAASGEAGAMGGMASSGATGSAAITPAFESGAVGAGTGAAGSTTGSLIDAGAITPAMSSGSYGGMAGASGTGTLGTAGTAAATNMLTPAFESMGGASSGLLGQMQDGYKQFNKYDQYRSNINRFSTPDNSRDNAYKASAALADQVLNSNDPRQDRIRRIADRISMNRWGMRQ